MICMSSLWRSSCSDRSTSCDVSDAALGWRKGKARPVSLNCILTSLHLIYFSFSRLSTPRSSLFFPLHFSYLYVTTFRMAPTKKDADKGEKEAKLTPEQSATLVLNYLRKQNRPYSATDISTNLKNRVTKAAAAKLLKDMHERNEIEGRAAGKQIVYHAIQVCTPVRLCPCSIR